MDNYTLAEKLQNFFSVVAGVLITIVFAVFFIVLFFAFGLFDWANGEYSNHADTTTPIVLIISIIIPCIVGGFATTILSTRNDKLHIVLTIAVVLIILIVAKDFDFSGYLPGDFLLLIVIPLFISAGGWLGIKRKARALKKPSSPTDTSGQ